MQGTLVFIPHCIRHITGEDTLPDTFVSGTVTKYIVRGNRSTIFGTREHADSANLR